MVQIVGKYEHVSNAPNFEEYLKAVGTPAENLKPFAESKPTITISEAGGQWTFTFANGGKESTSTFKLGDTYDELIPPGLSVKSVTKKEGDKLITQSSSASTGKGGTRTYEFNDAGLTMHMCDSQNNKTSRTFKRV